MYSTKGRILKFYYTLHHLIPTACTAYFRGRVQLLVFRSLFEKQDLDVRPVGHALDRGIVEKCVALTGVSVLRIPLRLDFAEDGPVEARRRRRIVVGDHFLDFLDCFDSRRPHNVVQYPVRGVLFLRQPGAPLLLNFLAVEFAKTDVLGEVGYLHGEGAVFVVRIDEFYGGGVLRGWQVQPHLPTRAQVPTALLDEIGLLVFRMIPNQRPFQELWLAVTQVA